MISRKTTLALLAISIAAFFATILIGLAVKHDGTSGFYYNALMVTAYASIACSWYAVTVILFSVTLIKRTNKNAKIRRAIRDYPVSLYFIWREVIEDINAKGG
ncbi:hypothetical protein [Fulvimarina sp. MAC8]|uniref:hypothetical protein n=1 Tax=Fulvimarina sp. MAC8 TaxID=3162874 RepID=UPI0032EC8FF5